MKTFKQFLNDENGATAIEYGLIAALIAVAAVAVMGDVGESLNDTFSTVNDELSKGAKTN